MPSLACSVFGRSVVYVCAHSSDGAMGLVLNRRLGTVLASDLVKQLGLQRDAAQNLFPEQIPVHFGGPVEEEQSFVLHSGDYSGEKTMAIDDHCSLTDTLEIYQDLARGAGPRRWFLALGYARWAPGQLEQELRNNGWLIHDPSVDMIFDQNLDRKWERSLAGLGIGPSAWVSDGGRA